MVNVVLWRYPVADFLGSLNHRFRIAVRQTEFGQDGMLLGVVFSGGAKYVHHLTGGVVGVVGPVGNPHYGFVAILSATQFCTWNVDIGGEELGIGEQARHASVDFQSADEHLILFFKDIRYLGFRLVTTHARGDCHAHTVAVESMHAVTFGHEYLFGLATWSSVENNAVLAVGTA